MLWHDCTQLWEISLSILVKDPHLVQKCSVFTLHLFSFSWLPALLFRALNSGLGDQESILSQSIMSSLLTSYPWLLSKNTSGRNKNKASAEKRSAPYLSETLWPKIDFLLCSRWSNICGAVSFGKEPGSESKRAEISCERWVGGLSLKQSLALSPSKH